MSDDNYSPMTGWVKVHHPTGLQVTLPIPTTELITTEAAKLMLMNVSNLIGAGWLVNAPGLEDGEKEDFITRVVRRVKANDDGTETPVVDIYPGRANFRILGVYLNTPADVKAFENASGMKVADLPLYEGDNSIECGKGPKTDKYVVTAPRPFKVIFKLNPAYEGDEDKKHPKRLFVRWGVSTPSTAPDAVSAATPASPATNLAAAKAVVMHLPIKQDPTLTGKTLGELEGMELGRKVIRYIAESWQPNGGGETDVKLKEAATVLASVMVG